MIGSISIMKGEARVLKVLYDHGFKWPWKPSSEAVAGEGTGSRIQTIPVGRGSAGLGEIGYAGQPGLSVEPNPGTGSVSVTYGSREPGEVRMVVYNTAGRVVRTIPRSDAARSGTEWIWDGRSDAGEEMPPGIYFVTVHSAKGEATAKIILLR